MNNEQLNITYLLGAGASANALPIIMNTDGNGIQQRLKAFPETLDTYAGTYNSKYDKYVKELKSNLIWLASKTEEFTTPDIYAKFLFLTNTTELKKLKNTLSAFFVLEQLVNDKFDKRPLIFITSLLERRPIFPTNVKILTWNYDFQLQIAAEYFTKESFTADVSSITHSPPLIGYYPSLGSDITVDFSQISIVHLNGIAGAFHAPQLGFASNRNVFEGYNKDLDRIFALLSNEHFNNGNLLLFAWENHDKSRTSIEYAKRIAEKTNILVVIGYSFPFFNREVDQKIFTALKSSGKFNKIYFQNPDLDGEFLKNQFELSDSVSIKSIKSKGNYFIPLEL